MVNIIARGIQHALLVPERHRSKTQRDCVGVQWLVGWEHPRRARLGLIEAAPSPAASASRSPRIRGARASASLKLTALA